MANPLKVKKTLIGRIVTVYLLADNVTARFISERLRDDVALIGYCLAVLQRSGLVIKTEEGGKVKWMRVRLDGSGAERTIKHN